MATPPLPHSTFVIAGIATHVYGLPAVLQQDHKAIDVVFVLHGRTQQYHDYEHWIAQLLSRGREPIAGRGLLVVAIDQRNHGQRKVSELANLAWADGNTTHFQDMFGIYYGTSKDVSLMVNFLPHYLFPRGDVRVANWICTGISLGGHATYCVLSDDPRVAAGVVVIGCPDITALMRRRAEGGAGDKEAMMPEGLCGLVEELGPRVERVREKDVLIQKGEEDPLVLWEASEGFVGRLLEGGKGRVEVKGYEGVGHAFPEEMQRDAVDWIGEWRRKH